MSADLATRAPRRLTPTWRAADAAAPVYIVRQATLDDRTLFEAELGAAPWHAGRVHEWQKLDALRNAVTTWFKGDADGEQLGAILDGIAQGIVPEGESLALLLELEKQTALHWPETQALLSRIARREEVLPLLAVRCFLAGWENVAAEFVAGFDGRPNDATLNAIEAAERRWLGLTIYNGLYVSAPQGKPSAPPPPSSPAPATSGADVARRTAARDGTSKATRGKKTRG